MERKIFTIMSLICIMLSLSSLILAETKAKQNTTENDQESAKIQISKVIFVSRNGRILHSIKTGEEFNILVFIESLEERQGWGDEAFVGFWLEIWVDNIRYANWGTGVYKGNFVVYSSTHCSLVFNEPGEHLVKVKLFDRIGDSKGELIEEQTITFTVRGRAKIT